MKDTYGLLEVSGEVSAASAVFVDLMAAELDRRDARHPMNADDVIVYADAVRTIAYIKAKNGDLIV
jgi:hypothetical protein